MSLNDSVIKKASFIPYDGKEDYVFISYAHKDSDNVIPVLERMNNEGYRIWYDDGIMPGSEWPEYIAEHLKDCAAVISFISPEAINSHNCRREMTYAMSKKKPFLGIFLCETNLSPGRICIKVLNEMVAYNGYMQETECEKSLGFDFINTYPYGFIIKDGNDYYLYQNQVMSVPADQEDQ